MDSECLLWEHRISRMGSICLHTSSNNRIFSNIQEILLDQYLWVFSVDILNENLNLKENISSKQEGLGSMEEVKKKNQTGI